MFKQFGLSIDLEDKRVRAAPKSQSDQDYYDLVLLERVLQTYQREMVLFGYDQFDLTELAVKLQNFRWHQLHYDYRNDVLTEV